MRRRGRDPVALGRLRAAVQHDVDTGLHFGTVVLLSSGPVEGLRHFRRLQRITDLPTWR